MGCDWLDPNHTYFQLANMFLAFSYLVPNTLKGLFVLRFVLGTAGFFFCMWAGIVICSPDTFGWNFAFMVINFGHVAYLFWTMRPISFEDEHEVCYENVFELLGVARWQYKIMSQIGVVREMKKDEYYSTEDETDGPDISIVLHGSFRVLKAGNFLGRVKPYEFLDSPEWIASTGGGAAFPVTYEVTIISEGAVIISWNRNALVKMLRKQPFVKNIFDSVIGQDVAKKIFKQNKAFKPEVESNAQHVRSNAGLVYNFEEPGMGSRTGSHLRLPGVHDVAHSPSNHLSINTVGKDSVITDDFHVSIDDHKLNASPDTNL